MGERDSGLVDLPHGGRLYYEIAGSGADVALLHPGLWDSRTWDPQFERWADRFRVLRYDQRGYGRSSRLDGSPFSHVRDLVALLDHLGIGTTALVGCSMGGALAIDAALTVPDRVWALVAVAPGLGGFEGTAEEEAWWDERAEPIEAAITAGEYERAQDLLLEIWAPLGVDDAAGARIKAIARDNIHELTMDESTVEPIDPPAALRLADVDVPTLVVEASHDPHDARRASQLIAREVADGRLVTIEADHVVNMRAPAAFDDAVVPFLEGRAAR
ncbi:MAG: alpha/beta fold hydrolase [Actinomycetota bacterium]|nr:alpha/beta fold hydrolase [Actinomycetota bacterium]MDH5314013.1 alpha/beta fold hydrolase [Actinomycetota bacterium]